MSHNHDSNYHRDLIGIFEIPDYPAPITFDSRGFEAQGVRIVILVSPLAPPLLLGGDDIIPFNHINLDIPGFGPRQIHLCDHGTKITRAQFAEKIARKISPAFMDKRGFVDPRAYLMGIYLVRDVWKVKVEIRSGLVEGQQQCDLDYIPFNNMGSTSKCKGVKVVDIPDVVKEGYLENADLRINANDGGVKASIITSVTGYEETRHFIPVPITLKDLALLIHKLLCKVLRRPGTRRAEKGDVDGLYLVKMWRKFPQVTWNVKVVRHASDHSS